VRLLGRGVMERVTSLDGRGGSSLELSQVGVAQWILPLVGSGLQVGDRPCRRGVDGPIDPTATDRKGPKELTGGFEGKRTSILINYTG